MQFFFYRFNNNQPFKWPQENLMRLIWLHMCSFLLLMVCDTLCYITGYEKVIDLTYQGLALSSSYLSLVTKPWTFLTYSFVQKSVWSLISSVSMLYYFGQHIQYATHNKHILRLYFLGQMVGGLFFLALYTFSPPYQQVAAYLIGPSAAVYAMMTAIYVFMPTMQVNFYFVSIPFKYVMGFFLISALMHLQSNHTGLSLAQLSGALAGYLYAKKCNNRNGWTFLRTKK